MAMKSNLKDRVLAELFRKGKEKEGLQALQFLFEKLSAPDANENATLRKEVQALSNRLTLLEARLREPGSQRTTRSLTEMLG